MIEAGWKPLDNDHNKWQCPACLNPEPDSFEDEDEYRRWKSGQRVRTHEEYGDWLDKALGGG